MIFDLLSIFEEASLSFFDEFFRANKIFELKSVLLTMSVSKDDGSCTFEREWSCFLEVTMKSCCFDPLPKASVLMLLTGDVSISELSASDAILGLEVENPQPVRSVRKVAVLSRCDRSETFRGDAKSPGRSTGVLRFCLLSRSITLEQPTLLHTCWRG
jgi:hypothetical protein